MRISLTINRQIRDRLNALVATGLFGFNAQDAAVRLLCKQLEHCERDGWPTTWKPVARKAPRRAKDKRR